MGKSVERKRVERVIDSCFWAIDRAVNAACRYDATRTDEQNRKAYKLQDLWRELQAECERQERQHRALGRRLNQSLRSRVSVDTAVRYFSAMAVCREVPDVRTWYTSTDIRRDWQLGYALGEAFAALSLWTGVIRALDGVTLSDLGNLEYSKDLV